MEELIHYHSYISLTPKYLSDRFTQHLSHSEQKKQVHANNVIFKP